MSIPFSTDLNKQAQQLKLNDTSFLKQLDFELEAFTTTVPTSEISLFKSTLPPLITTIFHGFKSILRLTPTTSQILTLSPTPTSTPLTVKITHQFLTFDQRCQRFLNQSIPSGFESTGPLIRLNLSDFQLDFKYAIGICLLSTATKTVVSKLQLNEQFRNLEFELIGGVAEYVFTIKNDILMKIDYENCYYNSRLTEFHKQVVKTVLEGTSGVIIDATAGIGPFSIRLAKSGRKVIANDLNPVCYQLLGENMKLNKVEFEVKNLDAVELLQGYKKEEIGCVLMNLPELGFELLQGLKGFVSSPIVIFEAFSRDEDVQSETEGKLSEIVKFSELKVEKIRDVSNGKWMIRVQFKLNGEQKVDVK